MTLIACECSCSTEQPYADGSLPFFYMDEKKAIYMWKKLKNKQHIGSDRVRRELVVDEITGNVISRMEPYPNLIDYNLYLGVHLNGLHILTIKE